MAAPLATPTIAGKIEGELMHELKCIAVILIGMTTFVGYACSQDRNGKANWKSVNADNGAVYKIDLNSISHYSNGTADVVVYAVEGSGYNPENMRRLWFDCQGHFRDSTGPSIGPVSYVPPKSLAAQISQIVCVGAAGTQIENSNQPQAKDTPANYCAGFSEEACARITSAAEAQVKPSYCKPGFALVGSGLSAEQLRICYVINNEQNRIRENTGNHLQNNKSGTRSFNMTLSATHSGIPTISGSTDLPDGTRLLISINKPRLPNARQLLAAGLPMCEDDCLPASGPKGGVFGSPTSVVAGTFSAGPFSWAGKPFKNGTYEVEVFVVSLPNEDSSRTDILEQQLDRMKKPILTTSVVITP
jgi:hypothetical protein